MDITNPAVTQGVNIFVNIFIALVAFGVAITLIDIRKTNQKDSKE